MRVAALVIGKEVGRTELQFIVLAVAVRAGRATSETFGIVRQRSQQI